MRYNQRYTAAFFALFSIQFLAVNTAMAQETLSASKKSTIPMTDSAVDNQLADIIKRHQLTGTPTAPHPIPNIESPKAQLGMKLFFSKTLGGDKSTACASCHHPMLGGGDGLSLSIGVGADDPDVLGPHRESSTFKHTEVPRNAPTTFNIAFWKRILFHDGRIERTNEHDITTPDMPYPKADYLAGESLVQAQARFPITSADEMRGDYLNASLNQTLRRALAKRLQKNWLDEFRKGFNEPNAKADTLITEQNYSEALAAYEQSQVFIDNPWRKYIKGDKNALSTSAKQGALLFFNDHKNGGANCASCHSGDFFTDEQAYNTGMPQIGAGKKNGKTGSNDYGCFLTTKQEKDMFRFRTPSLLNVEVTGPWGHGGAYDSLEAVTRHMLNPIASASNYQAAKLKQKNIATKDTIENTLEALSYDVHVKARPNTTEQEVKQLVSFLKALTDPCTKDRTCLSKWIPDANENDPDGLQLKAINAKSGNPL